MTYARSILVPPGSPGTYHCVSRCVRRAWLCGDGRDSGRSFEHRRQWVEDRIGELAEIFAIAVWGYAVGRRGQSKVRNFLHAFGLFPDCSGASKC